MTDRELRARCPIVYIYGDGSEGKRLDRRKSSRLGVTIRVYDRRLPGVYAECVHPRIAES